MQNRLLYNWQPQTQVLNFLPQISTGVEWGHVNPNEHETISAFYIGKKNFEEK